jgi:hypothetical protein
MVTEEIDFLNLRPIKLPDDYDSAIVGVDLNKSTIYYSKDKMVSIACYLYNISSEEAYKLLNAKVFYEYLYIYPNSPTFIDDYQSIYANGFTGNYVLFSDYDIQAIQE